MGLLSDLFSRNLNKEEIPTRMPIGALEKINNGILPVMNTSKILYKKGEICHYVECAVLIKEKVIKHTIGTSRGFNFRVCKGITYRIGRFEGVPYEEKQEESIKGILYITNKRVVFLADNNTFDKDHRYLTSIEVHINGIKLQYGNKTIILHLHDGLPAERVLILINNRLQTKSY